MNKLIIILAVVLSITVSAQDNVQLGFTQDVALAIWEKDNGLTPFTTDVTATFRMNGYQHDYGYSTLGFSVEYADLAKSYKGHYFRYDVQAGYSFNYCRLLGINFTWTPLFSIGAIHRQKIDTHGQISYALIHEISIRIIDGLYALAVIDMQTRPDIDKITPNGKLGFIVILN